MMCYSTREEKLHASRINKTILIAMTFLSFRRAAKYACLFFGALGCSCLLTSCSTCGALLNYLVSLPFNIINAVLP